VSKAKQKGTAFERLMVDYLNAKLPVTVERRAQEGIRDRGDVSGIPEVVCELKNRRALELGPWVREAEDEADRDGGSLPCVIHKRKGFGDPSSQFVTMPGWAFVELLKAWLASIAPPVHPQAAQTAAEVERLIKLSEAQ
jgi:hypothetical protein